MSARCFHQSSLHVRLNHVNRGFVSLGSLQADFNQRLYPPLSFLSEIGTLNNICWKDCNLRESLLSLLYIHLPVHLEQFVVVVVHHGGTTASTFLVVLEALLPHLSPQLDSNCFTIYVSLITCYPKSLKDSAKYLLFGGGPWCCFDHERISFLSVELVAPHSAHGSNCLQSVAEPRPE